MFLAAVGAGPVYKLLGKKDLGTTEFPPGEPRLSTATLPTVNMAAATPTCRTGRRS